MPADLHSVPRGPAHPPLWLGAAAFIVRHLPAGRYRFLNRLRRFVPAPFTARLAADIGGLRFECDPRDSVASEVAFTGRYEPQETAILSHLLRDGDVFVDAGANWGYFTLAAASLVAPRGRVLAFEPEPRLCAMLAANVARNALTSVDVLPVALAAGTGSVEFTAFDVKAGNWGLSRTSLPGEAPDFACATRALDDVVDEYGLRDVRLVKIDVEGAEMDVLGGMRRGLAAARYRYVLLECHPVLLSARGIDAAACTDLLTAAGYRLWSIDHTARAHERTARGLASLADLIRPYSRQEPLTAWPHFVAAAPEAADPH